MTGLSTLSLKKLCDISQQFTFHYDWIINPQGYQQAQSMPIWGEDNSIYLFIASNDPFGDRTCIKRLEGISEMRTWEEGLNTKFQAYIDFGYMFDVESAFARVDFATA